MCVMRLLRLCREVRALKSGLKDDNAVTGSRLYRDLDRRMQVGLTILQCRPNSCPYACHLQASVCVYPLCTQSSQYHLNLQVVQ